MQAKLAKEIKTTLKAARQMRRAKGMGAGYGMSPRDLAAATISDKYNVSKTIAKKMVQEARPNSSGLSLYTNSLSTIPPNRFAGGSFKRFLNKAAKGVGKVLRKTQFISSLGIPGVSQAAKVFGYGRGGCSPLTMFGSANMYKGGRLRKYKRAPGEKFPNFIGMGRKQRVLRYNTLKNIYH